MRKDPRLSDSEDDCSDDPAIGTLRADLRNNAEKFFIRKSRPTPPTLPARRASEYVPTASGKVVPRKPHISLGGEGQSHQNSCNGVSLWERSIGMSIGMSESRLCSADDGSMFVAPAVGLTGSSVGPGQAVTDVVGEAEFCPRHVAGAGAGISMPDDNDGGRKKSGDVGSMQSGRIVGGGGPDAELSTMITMSLDHAKANRALYMPSGDTPYTPSAAPLTPGIARSSKGRRGFLSREAPYNHSPVLISTLKDLRARSEDASRILEALKVLMVEDAMAESTATREMRQRRQHGPDDTGRLGSTSKEHISDMNKVKDSRRDVDSDGAAGENAEEAGAGGQSKKRMPLLLLAMDHLQHITAELSELISVDGENFAGDTPMSSTRDHRRRLERELRPKPRSSSVLLRRRRSAVGQTESISCGVPRYRVQVGKFVDEVYFELSMTQARSMWTVERRLDEFFTLRVSLVATAADLATAAAAAKRQRTSNRSWDKRYGEPPPAGGDIDNDDAYRQAELRVPVLAVKGNGWFEKSSLKFILSGRKREEILAEKQVLLASWLANILADAELMSPDLVLFLGGGDGGVLAQPIVDEPTVRALDEEDSSDTSDSKSTGFEQSEDEEGICGSRFASGEWAWTPPPTLTSGGDEGELDGELLGPTTLVSSNYNIGSVRTPRGKRAILRRSLTRSPLRAPRDKVTPCLARSVSMEEGGAIIEDFDDGGVASEIIKAWGLAEEDEDQMNPMLVHSSPDTSPPGDGHQLEAPSPSTPSPVRQVSLDAFFRAPT